MTEKNLPKDLPEKSGVYIMRDAQDKVLYIGKAKSIKKRVQSYFKDELDSPKTRTLMKQYHRLEYIVTDTEKEALILESNLIKKHLPRYNIRLKDDKRYPYIKITKEVFPRILITRKVFDDGSYYYGPFTDVNALRKMLKFLKAVFKIRECKNMDGPCLNYQINLCNAPCDGKITDEEYQDMINKVHLFFQGKYTEIISLQKKMMDEAARMHEYEKAAVLRDQIESINDVIEKQKMEFNRNLEQDVVACSSDEHFAVVVVFSVRHGKIIGKNDFLMSLLEKTSPPKILSEFIKQYYSGPRQVPKDLLLQNHLEDEHLITQWLKEFQKEITIKVPKKGLEYRLIRMVEKNADIIKNQRKQMKGALLDLKNHLGISKIPKHIEAFDISNLGGKYAVGSMVVFEDGKPKKKRYRRYKIKTSGPDDYAMMKEVLYRRYKKLILPKENRENPLYVPDLILVDGGKGQLNVALDVLKTLKLGKIPIIGLAKEFEYIFIPQISTPIVLPPDSKALLLLQRVRDEAHRFAITYHKKLRSKDITDSVLNQIPGIGSKRKNKLMKHFHNLPAIEKATVDQIASVEGININLARKIHQHLHKKKK